VYGTGELFSQKYSAAIKHGVSKSKTTTYPAKKPGTKLTYTTPNAILKTHPDPMILNGQMIDPEEVHFLKQIKKELSLETDYDAIPLVAAVLQALRQTLTLQSANALLNKLPDFLKFVFACNWRQDESQYQVEHLDEFVNLVMERDSKEGKFLFKSELQTLTVIILTLEKLNKLMDLNNFEGLKHAFRHELREASTEVAMV
jgi:uncharacterized protein (DUF2267 family)